MNFNSNLFMNSPQKFTLLTGRKIFLIAILLLPIGCLLWRWNALEAQVPLHFSRGGADAFGSKYVLIGLVLVPALVYAALPFIYRVEAENDTRRQIGIGTAIFLSLALCFLVMA